jgi:hypothetical protein
MAFKPIVKGMLATNFLTAFILNAFVGALVATIIVEVRRDMDKNQTAVFKFVDRIVERFDPDPFKTEFRKMIYTFIAGFFCESCRIQHPLRDHWVWWRYDSLGKVVQILLDV